MNRFTGLFFYRVFCFKLISTNRSAGPHFLRHRRRRYANESACFQKAPKEKRERERVKKKILKKIRAGWRASLAYEGACPSFRFPAIFFSRNVFPFFFTRQQQKKRTIKPLKKTIDTSISILMLTTFVFFIFGGRPFDLRLFFVRPRSSLRSSGLLFGLSFRVPFFPFSGFFFGSSPFDRATFYFISRFVVVWCFSFFLFFLFSLINQSTERRN